MRLRNRAHGNKSPVPNQSSKSLGDKSKLNPPPPQSKKDTCPQPKNFFAMPKVKCPLPSKLPHRTSRSSSSKGNCSLLGKKTLKSKPLPCSAGKKVPKSKEALLSKDEDTPLQPKGISRTSKRLSLRSNPSTNEGSPKPDQPLPQTSKKTSERSLPKKQPVWMKEKDSHSWVHLSRRVSRRISLKKNRDVYELDIESDHSIEKKKKKRIQKKKPANSKKKLLKSGHTSTILTTDPLFENKFKLPLAPAHSRELRDSNARSESLDESEAVDPFSDDDHEPSHKEAGVTIDNESACPNSIEMAPGCSFNYSCTTEDGYEASVSITNETESSYGCNSNSSIPSPPFSLLHGTTSTPRYPTDGGSSTSHFNRKIGPQDEVKLCFGFDDSSQDSDLNVSPVKKIDSSMMNLNAFIPYVPSDCGEFDGNPTRFAVPFINQRRPLMQLQNFTKNRSNVQKTSKRIRNLPHSKSSTVPLVNKLTDGEANENGTPSLSKSSHLTCKQKPSEERANLTCTSEAIHNDTIFSDLLDEEDAENDRIVGVEVHSEPQTVTLECHTMPEAAKNSDGLPSSHNVHTDLEMSPLKDFTNRKPPRMSYSRTPVLEMPQPIKAIHITKAKKRKKPNLKKCQKENVNTEQSSDESRNESKENKATKPTMSKKRKVDKAEQLWLSKINSDFSEVDDFELVIE